MLTALIIVRRVHLQTSLTTFRVRLCKAVAMRQHPAETAARSRLMSVTAASDIVSRTAISRRRRACRRDIDLHFQTEPVLCPGNAPIRPQSQILLPVASPNGTRFLHVEIFGWDPLCCGGSIVGERGDHG